MELLPLWDGLDVLTAKLSFEFVEKWNVVAPTSVFCCNKEVDLNIYWMLRLMFMQVKMVIVKMLPLSQGVRPCLSSRSSGTEGHEARYSPV